MPKTSISSPETPTIWDPHGTIAAHGKSLMSSASPKEWSAKADADFSGNTSFPWMVLCRSHGPCEPNVFACQMSEANAKWLAEQLNGASPKVSEISLTEEDMDRANREYIAKSGPKASPLQAETGEREHALEAALDAILAEAETRWCDIDGCGCRTSTLILQAKAALGMSRPSDKGK